MNPIYLSHLPCLRRVRQIAACGLAVLFSHSLVLAQTAQLPQPPAESESAKPADEEPPQYFETVTVSSTLNPATTMETPGTVSVIEDGTIERRLLQNIGDLVKFEPGVYIDANITRIGLNGFNIRGIGGNRLLTQVDGVETSEQFDFGPFNVQQFTLDLDALKRVEIMRSSGSSVYGSDALGGVVSFFTKDPADYLQGRRFHAAGKAMFDSRASETSGNFVLAGGSSRVLASAFMSYQNGHQPKNQGTVRTENTSRTALNPQDRSGGQALAKLAFPISDGNLLRAAFELADTKVFTNAYSSRVAPILDITSDDTMHRQRFSVDQSLVNRFGLTQVSWSGYLQQTNSDQVVDEVRAASGPTPAVNRSGTLGFSQDSFGGTLQGRKAYTAGEHSVLLTFGGAHKHHTFDMLRDRLDLNIATGAVVPATGGLILPSKYFPKSEVGETGTYAQGEIRAGRLMLVPGIRFDRFTMNADETDAVYIATLSPTPADFSASAISTRLGASFRAANAVTVHGQWAEGFRAPPYSAINSGFTNLVGGYTSIPNTSLEAETSRNFETGVRMNVARVSFGLTGFVNNYNNFIDQVSRGMNPVTRLLEFQYQNFAEVNLRGVELQGEARLSPTVRLRGSYAAIRGRNLSAGNDVALNSVPPNQGALGLAFSAPSNRWGSDFILRAVRGQAQETAGTGNFAPEAFAVADLTGWWNLSQTLTVRAGVMNLANAKYFEWGNVRGRLATDPTIDRYTSPGINGLLSVSYGW